MESDRRAYAAIAEPQKRVMFEPLAAARYTKWEIDEADRALIACHAAGPCLASIQADPAQYRALVSRHAAHIARVRRFKDYDYSRSPWPPGESLPSYRPLIDGLRLAAVEDMLLFAGGDRARALGEVCGLTTGLRRLMRAPENLLDSAIFRAAGSDLVWASAQMLVALPAGEPLPPECAAAFAPATAQEMSLCEPMRGEFAFLSRMVPREMGSDGTEDYDGGGNDGSEPFMPVLWDRANMDAQLAAKYAAACSADVARQITLDRPANWHRPRASRWRVECVGNIVGCGLMEMSPADEEYQHRLQDFGAQLRVLGTLAWLHEYPEQPLGRLPPHLRGAARPIEMVDGGRTLRVRMYAPRNGDYWGIGLDG